MNNVTLNNHNLNSGNQSSSQGAVGSDLACAINVSDYKWLTNSLKLAQQQFAVRPYYTCQIIDDSLNPKTITSISNPRQGSVVTSPDGKILAVGLDNSNNVGFWKIQDGTVAAQWNAAPSTILENNASNRNARNHYAIAVSDLISGTYKIDIYFFGNFDNGLGTGFLTIKHYYSLNGGTTWSSSNQDVNGTIIGYSSTQNIWIAAGKPYLDKSTTNIISTVFYLEHDGVTAYDITYQQYPGTGTVYNQPVRWSQKNINTRDWIIHSFDVVLVNGFFYVVFSAFHIYFDGTTNLNDDIDNFNIYISQIKILNNDQLLDIWSAPSIIISALSSSPQNMNSFTYPQVSYINGMLSVILLGEVVSSISNTNIVESVSTVSNFYIAQSKDLVNFTYLQPVIMPDGTDFVDTNANSFFNQGNNFFIAGNQQLVYLLKNAIVADVSNDVLNYSKKDTQLSASSLEINIGNANNKWYAGNPSTQLGYQAIAKNKKVNVFQGFYNDSGIAEVAPADIFYIDDITQNVTANRNDFTIAARNLYKNLKILTTKFAYEYVGIKKFNDIFDNPNSQNYNFVQGDWVIDPDQNALLLNSAVPAQFDTAVFTLYKQTKANTMFSVSAKVPLLTSGGNRQTMVYFYYVDSANYSALIIQNQGDGSHNASVLFERSVAGVRNTTTLYFFNSTGVEVIPFLFVRNNFFRTQVYMGDDTSDGQNIFAFDNPLYLGEEDVSNVFTDVSSVGFGGLNTTTLFKNFKYAEFDVSQNIEELFQSLATKSGIFDYKMPTVFQEDFFNTSFYTVNTGSYTLPNRMMKIAPSSLIFKNDMQYADGEIKFTMKLTPSNPNQDYVFEFFFRTDNIGAGTRNGYFVRIANDIASAGSSFTSVRLFNVFSSTEYQIAGTGGFGGNYKNNLLFDLTQEHEFRVVFFGSYFVVLIDDVVVLCYFDNNIDSIPINGYIGFSTDSNTTATIRSVTGVALYNQIEQFTFNPGDDLESAIESLTDTVRSFFFSDNFGRMKLKILSSDESSEYTYQEQIVVQSVDNSDKEYINQVTVNGNGVVATARDSASISSNGMIREEVINDFKITNYTDALARAQAELINFNKYNNQYSPKQLLNVGSELYDVVTVINTGDNSSNVNQDVRVYSQESTVGGSNADYWINVETGTL